MLQVTYHNTEFEIKIARKSQLERDMQSTILGPMHTATHSGLCPLDGEQPPG